MRIDPRDGKKGMIGFESMHDFDKMRTAVIMQRRADQSKAPHPNDQPQSFLMNGGSTEVWIRITGPKNTDANAFPGVITFRNLEYTGTGNPAWTDGEPVMVVDANDKVLIEDQRYKGQVYGTKVWGGVYLSMFVMVDSGKGVGCEIVKLTGFGTGIDGGVAWSSTIKKEVAGAVIDNGQLGGDDLENPYVLYASKADDGTNGVPEVGDYAYACPDPEQEGRWLFIPKRVRGADCDICWFAEMSTKACLKIEQLGGSGRCGCVATDNGVKAVYMPAYGGWLALKMGTTCCGCGGMVFQNTSTDEECKAVLQLYQYHVSCNGGSGGGGSTYTKNLVSLCTGRDEKTGQPFVVFAGWGDDPCSGDVVGCENIFRIKVSCDECPDTVCDCEACQPCCEGASPYGWVWETHSFSDERKNGFWIATHDDECNYSSDCSPTYGGSIVWTLSPAIDSETLVYTWTLESSDGDVYVNDSWDCCGNNIMTKTAGSGPDTLELIPIIIDGECPECVKVWPDSLTVEILEVVATGGATPTFVPGTWTLTKSPVDDWTPADGWQTPLTDPISFPAFQFFCANGDATSGCRGFSLSGVDSNFCTFAIDFPGCVDCEIEDCTCDPIYFLGHATETCIIASGCAPCGPLGSTVYVRARVTQ